MSKKLYRVANSAGQFWSGNYHGVANFNAKGDSWKTLAAVERSLEYFSHYQEIDIPSDWKIIELEIVEKPVKEFNINETRVAIAVRAELKKINYSFARFYSEMESRGCADKIEYILKLKPAEGSRWVDMDRIIEARSQLRDLGVKTRTFREYQGMFGMMDHEQALRARLTLDVDATCDLKEIITTVKERLKI